MDPAQQFVQAEQHFMQGRLQDAANTCKAILDEHPEFAQAYYLMGALFKTTGNFDSAVKFSDLAIKFSPNVPDFYVQKGHSLLCLDRAPEAKEALEKAHGMNPDSVITLLLLGDVEMKEMRFDPALVYFQKALAVQPLPEVYEHIGVCLQGKGDTQGAEETFAKLLSVAPSYASGHVHYGKMLAEKGEVERAGKHFERAAGLDPQSHEAWLGWATVCKRLEKDEDVIRLATEAIRVKPDYIKSYLFLGTFFNKKELYPQSEKIFHAALQVDPHNAYALQQYAQLLMRTKRTQEAVSYIEQYLAKVPNDPVMNYFYSVCQGKTVETAPQKYVSDLFDYYADQFEHHLVDQLGYSAPAKAATAIQKLFGDPRMKTTGLSLLDLGCGTGLGAQAVQSFTDFRVGVDLSSKMITKANAKKLYSETHVGDVIEYMKGDYRRFNLVLALDVLVYIGNLDPMFTSVRDVLEEGGLFAFSTESGDDKPPFVLRGSARYAHAKSYIEALAERLGFAVRHHEQLKLRQEEGVFLDGALFILQKPFAG